MNKILILAIIIIAIVIGVIIWNSENYNPSISISDELKASEIVVYKTPNCGCCEVYGNYLKRLGVDATTVDVTNSELREMSHEYRVPHELSSCHITMVGDYLAEGHVPLEVIEKLVKESPDISGITLPGMPSGTPGMPGPKMGDWKIYKIHHNGEVGEFMTL